MKKSKLFKLIPLLMLMAVVATRGEKSFSTLCSAQNTAYAQPNPMITAYAQPNPMITETQAPNIPTGLSATADSSNQINLSWEASTDDVDIVGYKIYRNGTQIGTSTNPSYQDASAAPNTRYIYTVSASDAETESGPSQPLVVLLSASSSQEDVATAIGLTTYGDTVILPPCDLGDCVWTIGIEITKDILIKGAGIDITFITNNIPGSNNYTYPSIFEFVPDENSRNRLSSLSDGEGIYDVSGITFTSDSLVNYRAHVTLYNWALPPVRRVRIHDNKFETSYMAINAYGYIYGVVYNNTFVNARGPKIGGAGYSNFGEDRMLPGDGKGWYVEDNTYDIGGGSWYMLASGTNRGASLIVRYNTATGTASGGYFAIESHGNQNSGIYGPQNTEIYGNSIHITGASMLHDARGGKNIVFYNKYLNNDVDDIRVREEYSDWVTNDNYPEGKCVDNTGQVQICDDSCICQKVHASYFFNNRSFTSNTVIGVELGSDYDCLQKTDECDDVYGEGPYPVVNDPLELVENREFFDFIESGFDGTVGVGCGAFGLRPRSCIIGTGYWATDQDCSDLSGMVGANPTIPISGTLLKCTAPGIWTPWYTPYPYPHPLRGEDSNPSNEPTLELHGTPANQAIHLNWDINITPAFTGTWTINYDGTPGIPLSPITDIEEPTRSYTITNLNNYELYTLTLNAMLGETIWLSDTIQVMPTDRQVFLPLIWR